MGDPFHVQSTADDENEELLARFERRSSVGNRTYIPEKTRWWILFWFSYLSGLQSLLWFTWSSVPDHSRDYLNVDDSTLNLFLNEGPIAYCVTVFFASWLLTRKQGLRLSVLTGTVLCFVASVVRCLPCLFSSTERVKHQTAILACVHIGQILNAAVAPLIVASPSYLSLLWFPDHQRNTATAIGNVANASGRAIGFFLGPAMVHSAGDLPRLLVLEIGISFLPLLCVMLYYPAQPVNAPSFAAAKEQQNSFAVKLEPFWESLKTKAREIGELLQQWPILVISIAGGLQMGLYGAWSGVLPDALADVYSDAQNGWLGSGNTFAGIAGGLLFGVLTDIPSLSKRLKQVIIVLCLVASLGFAVLAVTFPPVKWGILYNHMDYWSVLVICCVAGFLRGGTDPLFFEISADLAHPSPASSAGSILTFGYHAILVIMLSVPSHLLDRSINITMAGCMIVSAILVAFVPMKYCRR